MSNVDGPGLLTEKQVAHLLGVTVRAVQSWRSRGIGPVAIKLKGSACVRYDPRAVEEYIAASSCEAGNQNSAAVNQ